MRFLAASAVISIVASTASARSDELVLAQNLPVTPTFDPSSGRFVQDATFSDSMQSQGNYFYSQALAQRFDVTASSWTLTSLSAWAASEYIGQNPPSQTALSSNISALQVQILRLEGSTGQYPTVANWLIPIAAILQVQQQTFTPGIYSPVFRLDMELANNFTLSTGSYILTIGGVLADPEGSAFAWVDGQADGSQPNTQAFFTNGDVSSDWGFWAPVTDGTSGAFELRGVPAPGALVALAVAGVARRRRRD
ncbi:MAG: hypothetical protein FJ260_04365 [Planctomycetes bacterium]|nr:hypothetical protein [Planctomycetota bacterium]